MKTKSFEQVQEDALFLSQEDRLRLVHSLMDDYLSHHPDGAIDEREMEHVEAVLAERMKGPFVPVRNIKELTDRIRNRFGRDFEAIAVSGNHG